jgi:hypothetical protein
MLMALKMQQMKVEMMESETEYGMRRKYAAVKTSGEKLIACTVSKFLI